MAEGVRKQCGQCLAGAALAAREAGENAKVEEVPPVPGPPPSALPAPAPIERNRGRPRKGEVSVGQSVGRDETAAER